MSVLKAEFENGIVKVQGKLRENCDLKSLEVLLHSEKSQKKGAEGIKYIDLDFQELVALNSLGLHRYGQLVATLDSDIILRYHCLNERWMLHMGLSSSLLRKKDEIVSFMLPVMSATNDPDVTLVKVGIDIPLLQSYESYEWSGKIKNILHTQDCGSDYFDILQHIASRDNSN